MKSSIHKVVSLVLLFAILLGGTNVLQLVTFAGNISAIEQDSFAKETEDAKEEDSIKEAELSRHSTPRLVLVASSDQRIAGYCLKKIFLPRQKLLPPSPKSSLSYLCVFRL